MKHDLASREDLERFATGVAAGLIPQGSATVLGLSGDLGAGKTAFVKSLARALGVSVPVSSPTFVLERRYPIPGSPFSTLVHIDAYRLAGPEEASALRFEETLADPKNLVVIEWPEHLGVLVPEGTRTLSFVAAEDDPYRRTIVDSHDEA